jgi:hypothetical protein
LPLQDVGAIESRCAYTHAYLSGRRLWQWTIFELENFRPAWFGDDDRFHRPAKKP